MLRTINPEAPCDNDEPLPDGRPLVSAVASRIRLAFLAGAIVAASAAIMWLFLALYPIRPAHARDLDGHYAKQNPALHAWFDKLASSRGLCCSFADGITIEDVDWRTTDVQSCLKVGDGSDGHYCVKLLDKWFLVPDAALVTVPNKYGPAVVWPVFEDDSNGHHVGVSFIRCFMPGPGA